ncbi:hypothetical protein R1flu_029199 [Riccia fluitans]|uniref:Uncharacterized protein n=1 Tax=Riccia fluitans TaxID=41844 RepID=A0ABD1XNW9_9MARC
MHLNFDCGSWKSTSRYYCGMKALRTPQAKKTGPSILGRFLPESRKQTSDQRVIGVHDCSNDEIRDSTSNEQAGNAARNWPYQSIGVS